MELTKKLIDDLGLRRLQMVSNLTHDSREGSNLQLAMVRDCHVMLAIGGRSQAKVASCLPCDLIAEFQERFRQLNVLRGRAGALVSYRDDVVAYIVKANDPRQIFLIEVAPHSVAGVGFNLLRRLALRKNSVAKGTGGVPTLRGFFNQKNKFGAHR